MADYRRFFRLRPRAEIEMDQELEAHLQLRVDALMHSGMSLEEATRDAQERFGDFADARRRLHRAARDRHRSLESRDWFGALASDLRGAVRQWRRARGFALLAIATLALGIGVATMMFTLVERILLRPLPFPAPSRLVVLTGQDSLGQQIDAVSAADWTDWQRENRSLETTALHSRGARLSLANGDQSVRVTATSVSADFFRVLGTRFIAGRGVTADEVAGGAPVAVVSEAVWRRQFSADPALGMVVRVESRPLTIVGVVANSDVYPEGTELWIPRTFRGEGARTNINFIAIARLAPGVGPTAAAADLSRIAAGIRATDPQALYSYAVGVTPLHDVIIGDSAVYLRLLMGAVALLLLIVCANVATATLGRGAARSVEMAIRASIGAGRGRLIQQLLIEHLLLALAGGVVGIGLAMLGLRAVLAAWGAQIPRSGEVRLDVGVVAFAVALSVVVGVVAGIVPALVGSRTSLHQLLAAGGRTATRSGRGLAGGLLVGGEVALALLLLIGAGLLIRSFRTLLERDLGFDRGVVTAEVTLSGTRYDTMPERRMAYWDQAREAIATIPGVAAAGAANWIPLGMAGSSFVEIEGRDEPGAGAGYRAITDGYLETMNVPLLAGRRLSAADRPGSERVAVINAAMARRYWGAESPLGKRVRASSMEFQRDGTPAPWVTIVGVVGDVRQWGPEAEVLPEMYTAARQLPVWTQSMTLVARATTASPELIAAVQDRLRAIDPQVPADLGTMQARLEGQLAPRLLTLTLLTGFASMALLLAALGIYGVLVHAVAQRTRELAVRAALGATRGQVVTLVLRWAARIVIPGALVGLVGAAMLTRVMQSLLVDVAPIDLRAFVSCGVLLLLVALAAVLVPAYRAATVDPARNLMVQ
ncbi:MAG: ABC transporter permease [Gemmatimonadetes bacterium]|nr:ABC transporter permease [Gemmatimonadota bacterium]